MVGCPALHTLVGQSGHDMSVGDWAGGFQSDDMLLCWHGTWCAQVDGNERREGADAIALLYKSSVERLLAARVWEYDSFVWC